MKYISEVLSLCACPSLLEKHPEAFSPEVCSRAKALLAATGGSGVGAYTGSQGLPAIQQDIVQYIRMRDKLPESYVTQANVFLTDGAAAAIKLCLQIFINSERPEKSAYLVPTPEFWLYRTIAENLHCTLIPYHLNEEKDWELETETIRRTYDEAIEAGYEVKGLVVINPNNPTGSILSAARMRDIVSFCCEQDLLLLADEVLHTTCRPAEFVSFQKVTYDYEQETGRTLQLITFYSASKGPIRYAGLRSGYFVLHGFLPEVYAVFVKMVSIGLCANTIGQFLNSLVAKPPTEGTRERREYMAELEGALESLCAARDVLVSQLNAVDGIDVKPIHAGRCAVVRFTVPEGKKGHADVGECFCKMLDKEAGVKAKVGSTVAHGKDAPHFFLYLEVPQTPEAAKTLAYCVAGFYTVWQRM